MSMRIRKKTETETGVTFAIVPLKIKTQLMVFISTGAGITWNKTQTSTCNKRYLEAWNYGKAVYD